MRETTNRSAATSEAEVAFWINDLPELQRQERAVLPCAASGLSGTYDFLMSSARPGERACLWPQRLSAHNPVFLA
jgi:hypothetical protein